MAISPILNSGMIQRTDDVGSIKLQQEQRPIVDQQNAQVQVARKEEKFSHQVITPADSNKTDTRADARDEGKNKYFFQKKKKKKLEEKTDGRVVKKDFSSSFDMKV